MFGSYGDDIKDVKGNKTSDILKKVNADEKNYYLKHGGWPLDESKSLASQVYENDTIYVTKKWLGYKCYAFAYKLMNSTFACIRWLFSIILDFFGRHGKVKTIEAYKRIHSIKSIFPEWWNQVNVLLTAVTILIFLRSYYGSIVLVQWQVRMMYTFAVIWATTVVFFCYTYKSKKSLLEIFIVFICGSIHGRLVQIYVNTPKIAFNLLFISPILLFLAYGYDNYDYITKFIYQPLQNAVAPIINARVILRQRKQQGDVDSAVDEISFLQNNATISIAEETLKQHSAAVLKKASEVHTVFQIMVAGILADGSPNILLFMMSSLIMFETTKKVVLQQFPKISKTLNEWAKTGMENDVRKDLIELWDDFKKNHLANALFFLTDYVLVDQCYQHSFFGFPYSSHWHQHLCFAMKPNDTLESSDIRNIVIFGGVVLFLSWYWWKQRFLIQGCYISAWIIIAPFVLNYGTGPHMFKVIVWMSVSYCLDPQFIWRYLSYFMIIGEILKAPKKWNWKLDHGDEGRKKTPEEIKNQLRKLRKVSQLTIKVEEIKNKFKANSPSLKSRTI